jgi:hypothetical protein
MRESQQQNSLTQGLLTQGPLTQGPLTIPSLQFCLTGQIIPPERYHQDVHTYGRTIRQRAPQILDWYSTNEIEYWFNENKNWCETNLRPEHFHSRFLRNHS